VNASPAARASNAFCAMEFSLSHLDKRIEAFQQFTSYHRMASQNLADLQHWVGF
jgi:hypothetical protein